MNSLKIGALAAWYSALAYILGFLVLIFWLSPLAEDGLDSQLKLEFLMKNKLAYQFWMLFVFLGVGVALVFLVGALAHFLKIGGSFLGSVSKGFGLIWSGLLIASGMVASIGLNQVVTGMETDKVQARFLWSAIEAVHLGLGGGIELIGGIWVFLLTLVFRRRTGSGFMYYVGLITGIFGMLTAIPTLGHLGAVFGLLQILWFAVLGKFLWEGSKIEMTEAVIK